MKVPAGREYGQGGTPPPNLCWQWRIAPSPCARDCWPPGRAYAAMRLYSADMRGGVGDVGIIGKVSA
jgi:hypothetical protein